MGEVVDRALKIANSIREATSRSQAKRLAIMQEHLLADAVVELAEKVSVLEKMFRQTDDATAYPMFLVVREPSSGKEFKPVGQMTTEERDEILRDGFDLDQIEAAQEAGRRKPWDRNDFHMMDIDSVFWTKEAADAYCRAKHYNGPYFTWGITSRGVLQDLMKYTCEREIERRVKAEEFANAKV